jgi:hypothetical protein
MRRIAEVRIETRSFPNSLVAFELITRTAPYLRRLPGCVAIYPRDAPDRDVFYVTRPARSIVSDSCAPARVDLSLLPIYVARVPAAPFARSRRTRPLPRGLTGHVARPARSIQPS